MKYFATWYIIWIWTDNILSLRWPQNEFIKKYVSKIFQWSCGISHIFLWQFANSKVGKVIWEKLVQWSFLYHFVLGPMDLRIFRRSTAGRASNTSVVKYETGIRTSRLSESINNNDLCRVVQTGFIRLEHVYEVTTWFKSNRSWQMHEWVVSSVFLLLQCKPPVRRVSIVPRDCTEGFTKWIVQEV